MKRTKTSRTEYIPTMLRGPRPEGGFYEVWNIGSIGSGGTIFWHKGPFHTEIGALEMSGQNGWRIIHRHPDGKDTVDWAWRKDRWIKLIGNEKNKKK